MSAHNAPESDADEPVVSRRASAGEESARQVLTAPLATPTKTVRVSDDENFLGWLERAREAKPVDRSMPAAPAEDPEPAAAAEPTEAELLAASVAGDPLEELASAEPAPEKSKQTTSIDDIPAAIVVKKSNRSKQSASASSKPMTSAPARSGSVRSGSVTSGEKRTLAGDTPRAKVPEKRTAAKRAPRGVAGAEDSIDSGRVLSFEEYNEGKTRVAPLKRGNALAQPGERQLERPKFLDGKLPRSVERGVLHPTPKRIVVTSILLLMTKLLTIAVVIALPVAAVIDGKELIPKVMPLVLVFLGVGLLYILVSNRTRCRVCSCHFFYVRRCHKHKSAHRLPLVGPACTAALHILMFRWMRCMYCGTAIRLRGSTGVGKPKRGKDAYDPEPE